MSQKLGGGLSSKSEKEKMDTWERLSSMPSLSLPDKENKTEEGLSIFKRRAVHPAVAASENTRPRTRLLGVPECRIAMNERRWLYYCRPNPQNGTFNLPSTKNHPIPGVYFKKTHTSALALLVHHYHLDQHICCHEGPRICKTARSRALPELVYHGMFDCSVLPLRPPPHPGVAFVWAHPLLHSSHTLSLSWAILFPSSMPYNCPVKATQCGLPVPTGFFCVLACFI